MTNPSDDDASGEVAVDGALSSEDGEVRSTDQQSKPASTLSVPHGSAAQGEEPELAIPLGEKAVKKLAHPQINIDESTSTHVSTSTSTSSTSTSTSSTSMNSHCQSRVSVDFSAK